MRRRVRMKHISLRLNRAVRELGLRSGYDARRFWETYGRVFLDEEYQARIFPQHYWLLERINALRPISILEIGCGFGRNISFLAQHGKRAVGLDISHSMLKNARNRCRLPPGSLVQGGADRLPFPDLCFDLVFTMGLCMHVTPESIRQALSELVRVARRDIVLIEEWYENKAGPINQYTFVHDYPKLMQELPIAIKDRLAVRNREALLCIHGQRQIAA